MTSIAKVYLSECARRRIEPFYGFLEHLHEGSISADVDFASIQSFRLLVHALNAVDGHLLPDPSFPTPQVEQCSSGSLRRKEHDDSSGLCVLSLQRGVNKHMLHPPVKSNELRPYAKLAQRYPPHSSTMLFQCGQHLVTRVLSGFAACVRKYALSLRVLRLSGFTLATPASTSHSQSASPASTRGLPSTGFAQLSSALPYARALRILDLSDSLAGDVAIVSVLASVAQMPLLEEVHLAGCCLTDASADALLLVLASTAHKRASTQFVNSLRDAAPPGGAASGCGLRILNLARNALSDVFCTRLASPIVSNDHTLHTLHLEQNSISTSAVQLLLRTLAQYATSSVITFLNLTGNTGIDMSAILPECDALHRLGYSVSVSVGQQQLVVSRQQSTSQSRATTLITGGKRQQHAAAARQAAPIVKSSSVTEAVLSAPPPLRSHVTPSPHDSRRSPSPLLDTVDATDRSQSCQISPVEPAHQQCAASAPRNCHCHVAPASSGCASCGGCAATAPSGCCGISHGSRCAAFAPAFVLCPVAANFSLGQFGAALGNVQQFEKTDAQTQCDTNVTSGLDKQLSPHQTTADEHNRPIELDALLEETHLPTQPVDSEEQKVELTPTQRVLIPDELLRLIAVERDAIVSLVHALVDQNEVRSDSAIEALRGQLSTSNRRLEALAELFNDGLSTVQLLSQRLDKDRQALAVREQEFQEWFLRHPEAEMEKDVVALIHAGIDRIRRDFVVGEVAVANSNLSRSDRDLKGIVEQNKVAGATPSTLLGKGSVPPLREADSVARHGSDKPLVSQSPSNDTFISDVYTALTKLGW